MTWAGDPRTTTAAWRKLRKRALVRDGHRCRTCGAPANEVDHIVNVAEGGSDELENLQALCPPCHRRKTQAESLGARHRQTDARRRPAEPHPGAIVR